ncbi:cobyric acid synthase [Natrinema halophilum]|uniref:Probable cobyric acid synthase n=1 Tax=Natrinema halophilum TaxID=1699371 RepID=A0A7D5KX66_9EURY|nr:cobyric acid synthase [Natrinema halophilum]QLG48602.1 cobyric acid synthase [Natrinema halophilum]
MTRTLLVAGTASHVGKSTVAAGLCRLLADRGIDVAPFKGQNMSNNARVVVRPDTDGRQPDDADDSSGDAASDKSDDRWGEIGVSQFVQARAARTTPTTDCNPVLLKPRGNGESQLVLQGAAHDHVPAGAYYEEHWDRARAVAEESHRRLAADNEVIVAEGAGGIGEINLHDRDLANVETAEFADADVLLLADIERGGAFASLYGTIELVPDAIRDRIVGALITKFRGDPSLLEPGIDEIESRTGVPILGVLPYDDPGLPEEDSVSLPGSEERAVVGDDDGVPPGRRIRIAVPRLPRISNATDLEALASEPGVSIVYVPVDAGTGNADCATNDSPADANDGHGSPLGDNGHGSPLGDNGHGSPLEDVDADAVVLPGTKNTVDDLLAMHEAGFADALAAFAGPIVGICGGYQMLGERITNAALEGTSDDDIVEGLGLLPVETRFEGEKHLEQTTVPVDGSATSLLSGAAGAATGYEIHAGRTRAVGDVNRPLGDSSAACGRVLGTYLHGLFDNETVRTAFLESVATDAGVDRPMRDESAFEPPSDDPATATPSDRAARLVRDNVTLAALGEPFDVI